MKSPILSAAMLGVAIAAPISTAQPAVQAPAPLANEAATRTHCLSLAEDYLRRDKAELRESIDASMAPTIAAVEAEASKAGIGGRSWQESGVPSMGEQMRAQLMRGVDRILDRLRQSPPLDQEYVSTQRLGSSFVRHTHVLRFEDEGWRLDCTYYRAKNGWKPRVALPSSETMGDVFSPSSTSGPK
jgi:hypothetical protein